MTEYFYKSIIGDIYRDIISVHISESNLQSITIESLIEQFLAPRLLFFTPFYDLNYVIQSFLISSYRICEFNPTYGAGEVYSLLTGQKPGDAILTPRVLPRTSESNPNR